MKIVPSVSTRDARSLVVASWDTTPLAKSRKSAAPDSREAAGDQWADAKCADGD
jgi:hypothetical protein